MNQYNLKKMIFDMIFFRISLGKIKSVIKFFEIVNSINDNKVNLKELKKFKLNDLENLIKLYNRYTLGKEIGKGFLLDKITNVFKTI